MDPAAVVAGSLVAIAMAAVAHVARGFASDVTRLTIASERVTTRVKRCASDIDEQGLALDIIETDVARLRDDMATAHADLMDLYEHTGAKRERLG